MNPMADYANFAFFYDSLMGNADYEKRADYCLALFDNLKHSPGLILDLACGTGSLLFELKKRGLDIFGADISADMLAQAKDKSYENGMEDVLLLCQDMRELELYGSVDTVLCTLDSLNHLGNSGDLQRTFDRVSLFLNPGGYFIFDMNTVHKHKKVLADNAFVLECPEVFCVWQNEYHKENNRVQIQLDFFENHGNSYVRYEESFSETAYPQETVELMLRKSGFTDVRVYDDMSFSPPATDSQRLIYAAKK